MTLWIVYNLDAIWKTLESWKSGKKLIVLCMVDKDHQRSVVVIEILKALSQS